MVERQTAPYLLSRFLARLMLETWAPTLVLTAFRRRSLIRAAERHGYRNGEYVQGGGLAVSAALLRAASSRRLLDDPFLFFHTLVLDDTVLTDTMLRAGICCSRLQRPK